MKKIIILNYGLHISGVSKALVNLANALVESGHDVTIKLETPAFTLAHDLDSRVKCGLFFKEWRLFGWRIPGFLRCYHYFFKLQYKISPRFLHRIIVGKGYDVEIAFNRGAAARIIAASDTGATKLIWVHNDYTRCANPLAGFNTIDAARIAYKKFAHIVCVSKQSENAFREKFGEYDSLTTINNILNFTQIQQQAIALQIPKSDNTLCAIGRISNQKNYPMLLEAAALLKNRGVNFTLWIVGDGEDMNAVASQKDAMGLDNVILWGAKENPYPFLVQADGYVCSSTYEALSTTTIEALVLGKACVVTDCTGMRDILGDSEYGLIVPITAEALADGMQKIMEDGQLRKHYEEKALERAKIFAPGLCLKQIEELF